MKKGIIALVIVVVILFATFLPIINFGAEASAIGIIGGADGPTAIFITSKVSPQIISRYIMVVCIVISLIVVIKKNLR